MDNGPKAWFAVDLDSTLYDFESIARDAYQKLYDETEDANYLKGTYTSWVEWRSPADVCGIDTWMQVVTMCHQPEVILRQKPFEGAAETLNALVENDYGVMYISNREGAAAAATREWLTKNDFPMHEGVEVHCMMDDKAPYMAHCQYLMDDRPKTLIEFVYSQKWQGEQRKGISLLYEYNRALTDIPNIFLTPSWSGINSWLIKKGLLAEPAHIPLETK